MLTRLSNDGLLVDLFDDFNGPHRVVTHLLGEIGALEGRGEPLDKLLALRALVRKQAARSIGDIF